MPYLPSSRPALRRPSVRNRWRHWRADRLPYWPALPALALCGALAACGGGGGGGASPAAAAAPVATPTASSQGCAAASFTVASTAYKDASCKFNYATTASGTTAQGTFDTTWVAGTNHAGTSSAICQNGTWSLAASSCAYVGPSAADLAIQTQVPAPTYDTASAQFAIFTYLNQQRARCGMGQIAQNAMLDQAATAHAIYSVNRIEQYGASAYFATGNYHNETAGLSGFTGAGLTERSLAAGYNTNSGKSYQGGLGEDMAFPQIDPQSMTLAQIGTFVIRVVMGSVYHMGTAMIDYRDIGLGSAMTPDSAGFSPSTLRIFPQVLDFGYTTHPQQSASTISYPCAGTTDAAPDFESEIPDPLAAHGLSHPAGTPIVLVTPASTVVSVTAATVSPIGAGTSFSTTNPAASGGNGILVLTVANDAVMAGVNQSNRAYLVPLSALLANTQYRVHVEYTMKDASGAQKPSTLDFTFTTGATLR